MYIFLKNRFFLLMVYLKYTKVPVCIRKLRLEIFECIEKECRTVYCDCVMVQRTNAMDF